MTQLRREEHKNSHRDWGQRFTELAFFSIAFLASGTSLPGRWFPQGDAQLLCSACAGSSDFINRRKHCCI